MSYSDRFSINEICGLGQLIVCNPKNQRLEIHVVFYDRIVSFLTLKRVARARLLCRSNGGSRQCCSSSVISSEGELCLDTAYDLMFRGIASGCSLHFETPVNSS